MGPMPRVRCKTAVCGYRCVLKVPLPSWPHCNDFLTVWRRAQTCIVHLPEEEDGGDASDARGVGDAAERGSSGAPGGADAAAGEAPAVCGGGAGGDADAEPDAEEGSEAAAARGASLRKFLPSMISCLWR